VSSDPFFNSGYPDEYTLNNAHAPVITMIRGTTYVFNVNVPNIHPFEITPSNAGGQDLGVDAIAGKIYLGQFNFTPTVSTPNTLYYECINHLYMGNAINVVNAGAGSESSSGAGQPNSASAVFVSYTLVIISCFTLIVALM